MNALYILCLDDQREVLNSLGEDLTPLEEFLEIETCESAEEALELMEEIDRNGDYLAIVISDHVMPGSTGVEFLIELKNDDRFKASKKVLLTGLATHQDTIEAINKAGLDYYVEKPWKKEELLHLIKVLLTKYMVEMGIDYEAKMQIVDASTLYELLRK